MVKTLLKYSFSATAVRQRGRRWPGPGPERPTIATTYTYRLFGTINGALFDVTFACNPGGHVAGLLLVGPHATGGRGPIGVEK
jgi:hypothetical protein